MRSLGEPFRPLRVGEPREVRARVAWNRGLEQREPVGLDAFTQSAFEDGLSDPVDPLPHRRAARFAESSLDTAVDRVQKDVRGLHQDRGLVIAADR